MHEIVAGERRWRAAQIAKLHEVPVLERQISDREVLELAIVENVQRHDLSALEEAQGYRRLIDEFARSQEELAQQVGKSRAHIANTLRLLKLPAAVQALLQEGTTQRRPRPRLARRRRSRGPGAARHRPWPLGPPDRGPGRPARPSPARRPPAAKDADTRALEQDLGRVLGLRVAIEHGTGSGGKAGGSLTIRYQSLEQLDDVIRRLNRNS